MEILIRHWLGVEPADELERLVDQAAEAMWLEQRHWNIRAAQQSAGLRAIGRMLGG